MILTLLASLWLGLTVSLVARLALAARRRPTLAPRALDATSALPTLSVVVPMRNEARNIAACVRGLREQSYPADQFELVVVDDGSRDASESIVREVFASPRRDAGDVPAQRLLRAGVLPAGWLGKANACHRGAQHAGGEWVLFLDADVQAGPALLATAVAHARAEGLDMLSLVPRQRVESFWERALLMPLFLLLGAALPLPRRGSSGDAREATPAPVANGQFLLFRRDAYERIGGHAAVRSELMDDLAFARAASRAGLRAELLLAPALFTCRMYTDLRGIWNGMANYLLALLGASIPRAAATSAQYLLVALGLVVLPVASYLAGSAVDTALVAAGALLLASVCVASARYFRAPLTSAALIPLGMAMQAAVFVASCRRHLARRYVWRGREIVLNVPTTPSLVRARVRSLPPR